MVDGFMKRLSITTGSTLLVLASSTAYGIGPLRVGEWDLDFSGNANGFYTIADCKTGGDVVAGGLACGSNGSDRTVHAIQTGLLPTWFGFSAKTTQSGIDIGVTLSFQPGISSDSPFAGNDLNGGFGLNNSNFRQEFLTFGTPTWGTVKIGRDIGIFASDALLSDMTLFGVGTISDLARGGGNTTLGRIGTGYVYADWKAQVSYQSPRWKNFGLNVGLFSPYGLGSIGNGVTAGISATSASGSFNQKASSPRFEGKADYEYEFGDFNGKVWIGGLYQSLESGSRSSIDSWGFDGGVKVNWNAAQLVVYGYTGEALGTTGYLLDAVSPNFNERDSSGGYIQGTYKLPIWGGPKLGLAYGISTLDKASGENNTNAGTLIDKNYSITGGVYYPLTKALTLTAEYTYTTAENHSGDKAEEGPLARGGILFF